MFRSSWLAVAAVVAILAMHGLATHAASQASVSHASVSHASVSHAAESSLTAAASTTHDFADHEGHAPTHGEPGHEMSVLSLCLAALATAAVLLLRAARPRSGLLAVLPPAATTSTSPLVVRLHAPPDLHALSVLRC